MKKKFIIVGPKVQNVVYRQFLEDMASEMGLAGFLIMDHPKDQVAVIVLAKGTPVAISDFDEAIYNDRPPQETITQIRSEEYNEFVPGIGGYYMYLFSKNLDDVVLVLESINDRLPNARETDPNVQDRREKMEILKRKYELK